VRLVTLNSWKCDGAYARRLALMAEGLAALDADVIAVQEAFAAPALGLDTAAALADALGMGKAVLPLRRKVRRVEGVEVDSTSGVAVLSRLPILSERAVRLSAHPRDGERAALLVEVASVAGPVTVASLHLTHLTEAGALRRSQLLDIVDAIADRPSVLLAGDFNAPTEALGLEDTRFRDTRTACGSESRPTLVDGDASACIDHVLFAAGGALVPVRWRTALDTPANGDGLTASDHCAVVVDLAVRGAHWVV